MDVVRPLSRIDRGYSRTKTFSYVVTDPFGATHMNKTYLFLGTYHKLLVPVYDFIFIYYNVFL